AHRSTGTRSGLNSGNVQRRSHSTPKRERRHQSAVRAARSGPQPEIKPAAVGRVPPTVALDAAAERLTQVGDRPGRVATFIPSARLIARGVGPRRPRRACTTRPCGAAGRGWRYPSKMGAVRVTFGGSDCGTVRAIV